MDKHVENISMDIVELMLVTIPLSQVPGIRISHTLSQLPGILIPATIIRYPSYVLWDTDRGYLGYRIKVAGISIPGSWDKVTKPATGHNPRSLTMGADTSPDA